MLAGAAAPAQEATVQKGWTDTAYPSYIRRITHFGQRADWSHDGKRILFVEKTYGDVYEIDLISGVIRPMTHHYHHSGYIRALYLANGDILLNGARTFDPENHTYSRMQTAELWVLSKDLDKPPVPLGEFCSEGPAVSRTRFEIAWARDDENTPDLPKDATQLWHGSIAYADGVPKLVERELLLDSRNVDYGVNFEAQNFIPPLDRKIVWTAYYWRNTEVMTLDLLTKDVANISNDELQYDEPEGIFPDGESTLVESDRHNKGAGVDHIDLYRLALDGSGRMERLTYFNDGGQFKASNPVVSDDGRYIAFQVPRVGQTAGVGQGIYVMDLEAAGLR